MESLLDKLDRLVETLRKACELVGERDEEERLEKLLRKACNIAEDIRDSIEEMVEFAESISGVTPDEFGDFYDYEFEQGDYLDQGE
jgi:archaellum biogenesis protein FlaJ (TadC family)